MSAKHPVIAVTGQAARGPPPPASRFVLRAVNLHAAEVEGVFSSLHPPAGHGDPQARDAGRHIVISGLKPPTSAYWNIPFYWSTGRRVKASRVTFGIPMMKPYRGIRFPARLRPQPLPEPTDVLFYEVDRTAALPPRNMP